MKKIKRKGNMTPGLVVAAFAAALVVYALLIYTEKKAMAKEETVYVAVAAAEIKKGDELSGENAAGLMELREVPKSLAYEGVVLDLNELEGKQAFIGIKKGEMISTDMAAEVFKPKSEMKEPVLIGFKAEDYYQTAGGRIRPGDRIHIYLQDEKGEIGLRWSNVYVADAFDSAGDPVAVSDAGKTLRYNIYMEKGDVEEFYRKLDAKLVRIAIASD